MPETQTAPVSDVLARPMQYVLISIEHNQIIPAWFDGTLYPMVFDFAITALEYSENRQPVRTGGTILLREIAYVSPVPTTLLWESGCDYLRVREGSRGILLDDVVRLPKGEKQRSEYERMRKLNIDLDAWLAEWEKEVKTEILSAPLPLESDPIAPERLQGARLFVRYTNRIMTGILVLDLLLCAQTDSTFLLQIILTWAAFALWLSARMMYAYLRKGEKS